MEGMSEKGKKGKNEKKWLGRFSPSPFLSLASLSSLISNRYRCFVCLCKWTSERLFKG